MKKGILAILVALCLVGGAMPSAVWAENNPTELSSSNLSTHISNWDSTDDTLKLKAGGYQLSEDITIDKTLEITGTTTLDLNGHVLSLAQGKTGSVIKVTNGGLTLVDSNSTDTEHKFSQTDDGQWYLDDTNGTKTVTGGVITGGNSENGGGVYVKAEDGENVYETKPQSPHFIMNSGTIFGCNATNGGGAYVENSTYWYYNDEEEKNSALHDTYITINGGAILGCGAENGGGVHMHGLKSVFNMGGGIISNCEATKGGGIYISNTGTFNMQEDSLISDCKAENGGGVYIVGDGYGKKSDNWATIFNMKNGSIRNCHASDNAGGVYMDTSGNDLYGQHIESEFNMSGGLIEGCTAANTSAVYVEDDSSFTMSGGTIRKCKSVSEDNRTVCIKDADFELNGTSKILGIIYWYDETRFYSGAEKLDLGRYATVYSYYDKRKFVDYLKDKFFPVNREVPQFREYKIIIDDIEAETLYAHQVMDTNTITRPENPEIPGYEAVEEDKDEDGNCIWYESDDDFESYNICNFSDKGNWDTLYTRMTMKTNYTIKFDTGGGTTIADNTGVSWKGEVLKRTSAGGGTEDIETPTKVGYTFKGWIYKSRELTTDGWEDEDVDVTSDMAYKDLVPDDDAENDTITLVAQWEKKPVYRSITQRPTVITPEHGMITLSYNGRTATITPDEGYEITSVKVNDIEKGAVSTVTGLRTGDRIEVTFEKTKATLDAEVKDAVAGLDSMKARTSKTSKSNIKVVLNLSDEEKVIIANFREQGYIVKYRFYRSTKKSSGYVARIEKDKDTFINTVGSKGTRYYYKVRIMVYDESGNIVAKTALSDCKYASRVWSK